jgi:hypothetical protein
MYPNRKIVSFSDIKFSQFTMTKQTYSFDAVFPSGKLWGYFAISFNKTAD